MAGLLPARNARAGAFEDLTGLSGAAAELPPVPKAGPETAIPQDAWQQLPEKNSEPGFDWAREKASGGNEHYFRTADLNASLRVTGARPETLSDGTEKCALTRNTRYLLSGAPVFEGENLKVTLKEPLSGCKFKQGYVYMEETEATSLGGESELPPAVRAFLDTIAYARERPATTITYSLSTLSGTMAPIPARKDATAGSAPPRPAGTSSFPIPGKRWPPTWA